MCKIYEIHTCLTGFLKNFCTELHENMTVCSVADIRFKYESTKTNRRMVAVTTKDLFSFCCITASYDISFSLYENADRSLKANSHISCRSPAMPFR
jgi:hypothetical protein